MGNLTTVFLFTEDNSMLADMQFRVIIGIIALIIGIGMILITTKIKNPELVIGEGADKLLGPGIGITLWGIAWFSISLAILIYYSQRYDLLVRVYEAQEYEVVEGAVQVMSIQPKGGHAPGDIIQIGDIKFEVNYYSGDFGYETSIAHHGVLTEGKYVRVYYYDERILRIDLKQQ